jgi:ribonucleoside-diphosphate reductase beta chain
MARDAVYLEDKFIELAFSNYNIEGITKKDVKDYIRYITDRRLLQLGMKTIFDQKHNPMSWLDWILSGVSHDNFFEKRVTEYSVNGMVGDWDWK